jgi:hypothetical protein
MKSFKNLFQNQRAKINQTWNILSLGEGNSSLFNKRARSSSKGRCKNRMESFKNLLLKNSEAQKSWKLSYTEQRQVG